MIDAQMNFTPLLREVRERSWQREMCGLKDSAEYNAGRSGCVHSGGQTSGRMRRQLKRKGGNACSCESEDYLICQF